ncbi:MAG: MBL fold metallo-hydrolase [Proteobacteria bacterium]|nr:MBL fold metallo-hydrolase [Pseudomonadota bacterium]
MFSKVRGFLGFAFAALAVLAVGIGPVQAQKDKPDFQVIMLGVGTPVPFMHRFGPATLVIAGDKYLLFDAGRGVTQRLWQDKIPLGRVDVLFLTHLHSDHVVGIPDLLLTGWLTSPFGKRKGNFVVRGPEGTESMMEHMVKAFAADIDIRVKDQNFSRVGVTPDALDIVPGPVYSEGGIKVTAIDVNHGEKIKPTVGYRIDYKGRSVVISGDTKYLPALAKAAEGVDLFIHSIAGAKKELLESNQSWKNIIAHHTEPEDVGRIFAAAKPKMGALYHLVTLTNGKIKPPSLGDLMTRLKTTYNGAVTMGADRTRFIIGKAGVTVIAPPK